MQRCKIEIPITLDLIMRTLFVFIYNSFIDFSDDTAVCIFNNQMFLVSF
jgi:hypothetical protein